MSEYTISSLKVLQVLSKVHQLMIYQAEDPGWFLARLFTSTSITAGLFFSAIGKNSTANIYRLSGLLEGVLFQPQTAALPTLTEDVLLPL